MKSIAVQPHSERTKRGVRAISEALYSARGGGGGGGEGFLRNLLMTRAATPSRLLAGNSRPFNQLARIFQLTTIVQVALHRPLSTCHLSLPGKHSTRADQRDDRLVQFARSRPAIARNLLNRQFGIEALRIHKRAGLQLGAHVIETRQKIVGYEFFELSSFLLQRVNSTLQLARYQP